MTHFRKKVIVLTLTHVVAFGVGFFTLSITPEPLRYVWEFFLGSEVMSQASFPRGNMARVYSAWGFGEQRLIFKVSGKKVHEISDFAPGNVNEEIVWDSSGKVVMFFALGRKIYTYDTETKKGYAE